MADFITTPIELAPLSLNFRVVLPEP